MNKYRNPPHLVALNCESTSSNKCRIHTTVSPISRNGSLNLKGSKDENKKLPSAIIGPKDILIQKAAYLGCTISKPRILSHSFSIFILSCCILNTQNYVRRKPLVVLTISYLLKYVCLFVLNYRLATGYRARLG